MPYTERSISELIKFFKKSSFQETKETRQEGKIKKAMAIFAERIKSSGIWQEDDGLKELPLNINFKSEEKKQCQE